MAVYETYSRRLRTARGEAPDVYIYDSIPKRLRVQVRQILLDAVGPSYSPRGAGYFGSAPPNNNSGWNFIHDSVAHEMGVDYLAEGYDTYERCMAFIDVEQNVEEWLTLVEFAFRYVERIVGQMDEYTRSKRGIEQGPADAIRELNFRFQEAGVGYQYADGKIIRVDSQFVHHETVVPALQLLADKRFAGAQQEFLDAHAHYRAGDYKDCAIDALNAVESTMKVICDARGWKYDKGARASDLAKIIRANGLFPEYLDQSFDQLVATLKSGLPQVRNEEGGHGQGAKPKPTPSYVAAYALHLAAAKIVFLVEALQTLERK